MLGGVRDAPAPVDAGLDVVAWSRSALASLTDLPAVHRVGLALAEGGGRRLRFTASDRVDGAGVAWCQVDAYDEVPLNAAVRSGSSVVGALADLDGRFARFVERQRGSATVALAAVPIVMSGQILVGYVLFFDRPQAFDADQRMQLVRLGEDLGRSLRRAQR